MASLRVLISSSLRSLRWPSRRPSAALLLLVATAVFTSPLTAAGAINFVQTAGATNDSASISISQAFAATNTAGNLIVVAASWGDNPAPSIRASDTLGNTYVLATTDYDPVKHQGLAIFFAPNIRAGANTVTVNFGAADGYRRIMVSEYSGVATASPLDATARNQAAGATATDGITSTAATTSVNGDLIFGVVMDDSGFFGTITAGTGFTRRAVLNNMDTVTEDRVQGTAGPIAATFTFSRADSYLAQMAAFTPAGAGGGGGPSVSSVACNPTTVVSGATTTCTVTLTQPAPTNGSSVALASNNTAALSVPSSVTVPANSTSATFTATAGSVTTAQTVTVTATLGGTATTMVTVTPASVSLVSLAVTPSNVSIVLGTNQQFTATGTYSDGSTQNLTTSASWSSSVPAVATISNAAGSQGLASSVGTGSTTIRAVSGSVSGSTTLTVTAAGAAINFVQTAGATNDSASISISQAFGATNTAGNLIVVAASWGDNPAPSIRASDTLGNTYVLATTDYDPVKHQGLAIFFAPNIRAGANTVTVNFGAADGYRRIIVSEYSGVATASPLDATARNRAAGTTATDGITSTAATTSVNGDLIFGVVMDDSGFFGTITAGTGFTRRAVLNNMD